MNCEHCGSATVPQANFCSNCGLKIVRQTQVVAKSDIGLEKSSFKKNQEELIDIMYHNKLKAKDVAELLYCTPNNVRVWRCAGGNAMPDAKMELLKLKLKDRVEVPI